MRNKMSYIYLFSSHLTASLIQAKHSFCKALTPQFFLLQCLGSIPNQSVEKASVAFVRGADEISKFFEKINNQ